MPDKSETPAEPKKPVQVQPLETKYKIRQVQGLYFAAREIPEKTLPGAASAKELAQKLKTIEGFLTDIQYSKGARDDYDKENKKTIRTCFTDRVEQHAVWLWKMRNYVRRYLDHLKQLEEIAEELDMANIDYVGTFFYQITETHDALKKEDAL